MDQDKLPYDKFSVDSIMVYAERLEGHTLREMTDAAELQSPNRRRGAFGNAVEQYYFKYKPNSSQEPDFPEVGIELRRPRSSAIRAAGMSLRSGSSST